MIKKKTILFFLAVSVIFFHVVMLKNYSAVGFCEVSLNKELTSEEKAGFKFLLDHMQSKNGLIYSWVEYDQASDDILLEAMSQSIEYFALLGSEDLFKRYLEITDHYFISAKGYYFWKLEESSKEGKFFVTAFLDDLRIAKAYFIAKENGLTGYDRKLKILSNRIYKFNVDKNKYPVDFYDSKMRSRSSELSLFYIDLKTLGSLSKFDKKWQLPYEKAYIILFDMPENKSGLYPQKYKTKELEYHWQDPVNMVENLYTAINAKNAGRKTDSFVAFLKAQIAKEHIYNYYFLSGLPLDEDESASVYALAARFLYLNGEIEAARWCFEKTKYFQLNEQTPFYGGFGDLNTGRVYSFNQLESLLMFRYLEGINK